MGGVGVGRCRGGGGGWGGDELVLLLLVSRTIKSFEKSIPEEGNR